MLRSPSAVRWLAALGCCGALTHGCGGARAAGFAIMENSASGLGTAFAGAAADARDGSVLFFNPAGMVELDADQINVAGHTVLIRGEYDDAGSTIFTGAPLVGTDGGDGERTVLVPNVAVVYGPTPRLKLGLGVNAPFGLTTEYDRGFVGRYHGLRSEVRTVNINPSVAYRLTDWLSLGAGLNIQYIDGELTNAIDFGTIGTLRLGPEAAAALGLAPQQDDGSAEVKGDDWGLGYNLGLLLEPRPGTRIGAAYRSTISHELDGTARFTVPPEALPLTAGGAFTDTSARAPVDLPETATVGVSQRLGRRWTVLADVTWTNWSRFEELRVRFGNGQDDSVTEHDWHDSFRYAAGVTYAWSDALELRLGVAFDETPVPNRTRTPTIPDNDRYWVAAGLGYRLTERLGLDLGYAHLFVEDGDIDLSDPLRGNLRGSTDSAVDIIGLQFNWRFGGGHGLTVP
jgi:long-chain fatty acid transport protein